MLKWPLKYYGTQYGPGLTLSFRNGVCVVQAVHECSDAYGKIRPGDILLEGDTLSDTVNYLKGARNTTVAVTIKNSQNEENVFFLKRLFK